LDCSGVSVEAASGSRVEVGRIRFVDALRRLRDAEPGEELPESVVLTKTDCMPRLGFDDQLRASFLRRNKSQSRGPFRWNRMSEYLPSNRWPWRMNSIFSSLHLSRS